MKVLMVEPGKAPYETEIEGGLESLQKAVGGSIQAVYPYDDPVALICNEEGKLMGLPLNRSLTDDNGEIYDIIAGNFILTGLTEDNFGDLSPELMEKFSEQFKHPEEFVRIAGKILGVKQPVPGERPGPQRRTDGDWFRYSGSPPAARRQTDSSSGPGKCGWSVPCGSLPPIHSP